MAVSRRTVLIVDSETEAEVYLEAILISSLHDGYGEAKSNAEKSKA
jgi:hypothetical protein